MAPPLLSLKDIHLTFGGTPLLTGAEFTVVPSDRVCLVGRNGSGKSTLLKIAAGLAEPDRGERYAHPSALIRYLPQEVDFAGFETAAAYVESGLRPTDDPYPARAVLAELGLTGDEATATLSGGEARRVALARVLAAEPDVMLLDEPTNHLDLPAIEWLEARLASARSAIVLISHDRRFLQTVARRSVWLDRGTTRDLDDGFSAFEIWRDEILEQEELDRHKLDRKIVREDQWMHGGVTGRRKRNVRRVRELRALRQERREQRHVTGNVNLDATDAQQSGRIVIEAEGLAKSYDAKPVVVGFSIRVLRGDRLGVVGPNGSGKTTLLNLLTGEVSPDAGTTKLGANVDVIKLDQKRDDLQPTMTLAEALTDGRGDQVVINGSARHVASYMKDFLFLPEQVRSPLSVLSGGERARLMLARALAKPSNLLILDEPTNDLDLETLDLLQELLSGYGGTVILVSHDRDFLDRVVTSVVAPDGDGRWTEYAGGYADMLAQRRGADLATANAQRPARAKVISAAAGPVAAASAASAAKRKLSFKDKHALETLPARIDLLEADIARLSGTIGDATLYGRDPAAFAAATKALAAKQAERAVAEERWLMLEMLREEIEG